ncbi:MAG: hypothetical protein IBX69_13490 [Anaerolineales bacterium]|nr:hypothetical protein [Anaerolineales bacterium]
MILLQVQPPPPDNSPYLIAGYAVIFGIMIIYVISLILRQRSMRRDLELLDEIQDQE